MPIVPLTIMLQPYHDPQDRWIGPILAELAGMSARAAAVELNGRHIKTPGGAPWSAKTVYPGTERLRPFEGASVAVG